jgi:plasmid stability protein
MPSLLIRKLDDALHERIKQRARANHRSMEAEAREMLRGFDAQNGVTGSNETLYDIAWSIFGPDRGIDLDLPLRDCLPEREPPDFSGPDYDR